MHEKKIRACYGLRNSFVSRRPEWGNPFAQNIAPKEFNPLYGTSCKGVGRHIRSALGRVRSSSMGNFCARVTVLKGTSLLTCSKFGCCHIAFCIQQGPLNIIASYIQCILYHRWLYPPSSSYSTTVQQDKSYSVLYSTQLAEYIYFRADLLYRVTVSTLSLCSTQCVLR